MNTTTLQASYAAKIDQLLRWERYREALREAEDWVRADPDNPQAYATLSYVHMYGDQEKALYWSGEALRRSPELELAWRTRLIVAYDRKDWPLFERTAAEMLRLFPEESYIYGMRAQYLLVKQRIKEANEEIAHAISLGHSSLHYSIYAYTLALLGDKESSARAERTALHADPENKTALLYLGWAADARRDYKQSLAMLETAVRLDPASAQIRKEYMKALQKSYWFYRIVLFPTYLRRFKAWQIILIWLIAGILFRPLLVIFLVLYVVSYWLSRLLVHVKVFGWRRS